MRPILIEKSHLEFLYYKKNLSLNEIAKIYHCGRDVIGRNLHKFQLPAKKSVREIKISKNRLRNLYTTEKLSTYKIAEIIGCDPKTIYHKLKKYRISTRPRKIVKIDKKKLEDLYLKRRFSLAKIGKIYKCCPVAILKKMRNENISRRTSWETNEKYKKTDFDGNLLTKAYLLGFRAGDLGVRRQSETTGSIKVGCNSTKPAQINLIRNLFKDYGPVWVGKPNKKGVRSIDILLNKSFSFLLPKEDKIDNWILKKRNCLAAFTAGYTDAEGNIGIYDKRARFRLGSYDIGILKSIYKNFKKLQIKSGLRLETKAGFVDKRGLIHNGDFWRITFNEKNSLLSLFKEIGPYLKHDDKIKAMKMALKNISDRNNKQSFSANKFIKNI